MTTPDLTPKERQDILRRLKHGPVLPKDELAKYATKLWRDAVAQRKGKEQTGK
jgi:hypothetical protein